jgi:hypothetical protein
MAFKLTGEVDVKRINEFLNKVLGSTDLPNYRVLIDSENDEDSFSITLEQLLGFSQNTGVSRNNTFTSAIDFNQDNADFIYYDRGTLSGATTFSIGTDPEKSNVYIYTDFETDGSAINIPALWREIKNEYANDTAIYGLMVYWDGVNYQYSLYKISDIDIVRPTITGYTLEDDNLYIDVDFSEGVYGATDGTTPVQLADLSITNFVAGGATALSISSIEKAGGGALTGGETTIRCNLSITGTPNGTETFEVQPTDATSIFDLFANAMLSTETTGTVTMRGFLVSGVQAQYLFENNVLDTANNFDLTVLNTTFEQDRDLVANNALGLGATSDAENLAVDFNFTNIFSISMWVYLPAAPSVEVGLWDYTKNNVNFISSFMNTDGTVRIQISQLSGGFPFKRYTTNQAFSSGWNHIVWVVNNQTILCWIDNSAATFTIAQDDAITYGDMSGAELDISGRYQGSDFRTSHRKDDIRIGNVAWDGTDVNTLYNE